MKIMKNILIPIVLVISLFFNTSTIFAANNLNTTFNANNDELTVTVKNNSDKELSDVEYNLNFPSEYTAKYEVNPNYSLSPQEETTFKVKVSKSGDNVSNKGEQGTKTFTSSKKSLDNTGLTSELTVGAIVVLFLLVGVLLYFKQRKVFIILLVAGIGTQLFPRYSLAADKIRQTENFKKHVILLGNNIPVSLDVSYLIEGDSNNNGNNSGNNGNTINNNGSNSGNNGLNPNDRDPKEVLVAGYAYSGKTNNVIEEKELKVFDGDKEIATVKTDAEGYFFTHLIQDKTYTIKGEDFEVTVTAKNTGDYEHKDVVGKLTLGRELKDENTYIKVKPSVAYINEDIEYKVEGNKVTIEGERQLKIGDKLILAPNHTYLTGFAFIVNSTVITNGKTIVTVTPITTLHSIVDDFQYNEEVDLSRMKFEPADGWEIIDDTKESVNGNVDRSMSDLRLSGEGKGTLKLVNKNIKSKTSNNLKEVILELSLGAKFDIAFREKKVNVVPKANVKFTINDNEKINEEWELFDKPINLGTARFVTATGITVDGYLNLVVKADGKLTYNFTVDAAVEWKISYDQNLSSKAEPKLNANAGLNGEGSVSAGLKLQFPAKFLNTVKLVTFDVFFGPKIKGEYKGFFGFNYDNGKFNIMTGKGKGKLLGVLEGKANIDLLEYIVDAKAVVNVEKEFYSFDINKDVIDDIIHNRKIKDYSRVIEDIKNIKANKDNKQKLWGLKLNNEWNPWVIEDIAESNQIRYSLYDINKDGTDELLISTRNGNYLDAAFYLKNGNPEFLGQGFAGRVGGARSSIAIYNDGSVLLANWSSGTGKGRVELVKLISGSIVKIKSVDVDNIYKFSTENIGVSKQSELSLKSLEWKPLKTD